MQKPIDTTKRINQLLLRASKPLNTLGERKGVHEGGGRGQQGQTVRRVGTILSKVRRRRRRRRRMSEGSVG